MEPSLPMLPPASSLDPIVLLTACRKLDEAEQLARERVAQAAKATPIDRLAAARASRVLADVLLEAGKPQEASRHVYEARRRYRPFRNDVLLSAEVDLTLACFAFEDDRSADGEQILSEATGTVAALPGAELLHARLLRYAAHLQIARAAFDQGDALMDEALRAVLSARAAAGAATPESSLLLSQYLFTQGEVAFMRDDAERARARTAAALDVAETELREFKDYVRFTRTRAAHAHRVFGDMAKAEELEAKAEGRHG